MQLINDFAVKLLILSFVLALLPESPFIGFNALITQVPYLSWLNWFLPISEMLVLFESLLVVVAIFYGILYLLNYVGVLKS